MQGYQSHYVIVKNGKPCAWNETAEADEIVIFQEDQILPRYIVYFDEIPSSDNNVRT